MEEGVLRVVSINHHLQGEVEPPIAYTIKDDVVSPGSVDLRIMIYVKTLLAKLQ